MALQKVVYVLRDTGTERPVLTDSLPESEQEVRRVFVLEQKVDLVNENESIFTLRSVCRYPVQNTVEDYEHTDGKKLLAEVENVVADESVIDVNVRFLCERIKRTFRKEFYCEGDILRLRFLLLEKFRSD